MDSRADLRFELRALRKRKPHMYDEIRRLSMEATGSQDESAHEELYKMATGGLWYRVRSSLFLLGSYEIPGEHHIEHQKIALEAIAEIGTPEALKFLEAFPAPKPEHGRGYDWYMYYAINLDSEDETDRNNWLSYRDNLHNKKQECIARARKKIEEKQVAETPVQSNT